jgi:hypothetical protein
LFVGYRVNMFPAHIIMSESLKNPGLVLRELNAELEHFTSSNVVLLAQMQAQFLARIQTEQGGDVIQPSALMTTWFKMGKLEEEMQLQRKILFHILALLGDEKEHENMVKRQLLEKKRERQEKKLMEQQQKLPPLQSAADAATCDSVARAAADTQAME